MFRICSEFSVMFRICSEFSAIFRIFRICSESVQNFQQCTICSEFSVMFRICSEFSAIFRICSEFSVMFRIFSEFLVICVVLLCVFKFWFPCCAVPYDFRIKTMFDSSLLPVVCRRAHVLFILFVFVFTSSCL